MSPKSKIAITISLILTFSLLLGACAAASAPMEGGVFSGQSAASPASGEAVRNAPSFSADSDFAFDDELTGTERIVIKDASLSIVVNDPPGSMETISQMAEDMGGFVVSAQVYHTRLDSGVEVPQASITVRVPAERLNEALETIRSESDRDPLNESINSQDVTRDYTDLQSRLSNLEAAETQLNEIMGSATKTEDVLSVYNNLVQVREQIEVIKGQIQYYEQSAALSAISVELVPNEAVQPLKVGDWEITGTAKNAVQALINTLQFLVKAVIWIVLLVVPVLAVIFIIFVLPLSSIWRRWRQRRALKKDVIPSKSQEIE